MGRRSLPRIKTPTDLSRHLRRLSELSSPLDLDSLLERPGELEVEIGTGKGLFLQLASEKWPDRRFLGIEISPRYARFAASQLANIDRHNAMIIEGDGQRLLCEFLPPAVARAVHVYFPDPWWKRRHRKRRVMNGPLLQDVERVLRPGGWLYFRTDVEEYFHKALATVAQFTTLEGPLWGEERPLEELGEYRTHFERRMRKMELPVYCAEFRRANRPRALSSSVASVQLADSTPS
jgi:tRNA (guanine-N7-)-methyltransferase